MKDTYCLAHELVQLTRDTQSDVSCLQTSLTLVTGRQTNVYSKNFKEIIRFYVVIGKKNNQSSVFDADGAIPDPMVNG